MWPCRTMIPEQNPTNLSGALPYPRKIFGRTRGKRLRPAQQRRLEEVLPRYVIKGVSLSENPQRLLLDLSELPGPPEGPLWLEIGFGAGEHLVAMAQAYPEVRLLGVEPFINGVASALGRLEEAGATNVALFPGDVRDLFDVLPDACLAKVFLNYPDPWPKKRHHKRRFVTSEYLVPLARVCAPQAEFRLASDVPSYIEQARKTVPAAGFELVWDSFAPWLDWPGTRYEVKALREGRKPHYLTFRRCGAHALEPGAMAQISLGRVSQR